jgi:hypothetical protein
MASLQTDRPRGNRFLLLATFRRLGWRHHSRHQPQTIGTLPGHRDGLSDCRQFDLFSAVELNKSTLAFAIWGGVG